MIKKIFNILSPKQKIKIFFLFLHGILDNVIEILAIGMVPIIFLVLQGGETFFNFTDSKNLFFLNSYLRKLSYEDIVTHVCIAAIFIFLSRFLIKLFFNYYLLRFVGNSTGKEINNILTTFFSLPFEITSKYKISEIQYILENIEHCFRLIITLLNAAKEFVILIFLLILIFIQSPYVAAVIFFIGIFGILLFKVFFQIKVFNLGNSVQNARKKFIDNIKESVSGLKEITIFDKTNFILKNFKDNNQKLYKEKLRFEFINILPRPILELACLSSIVSAIFFINNYTETSLNTFATFLVLLTVCFLRSLPAFSQISSAMLTLKHFDGLSDKAFTEMNFFNKIYKSQNFAKIQNENSVNSIELVDCSFKYPNSSSYTLKNINLTIKKSEKIAFYGNTGCGKTSLINLIIGLLNPTQGHVFFNHKKRGNTMMMPGIVSQGTYIFNDSIINNITLKKNQNDQDIQLVRKLIDICQIKNFVENKENGYEEIIFDNAKNLSGGEKQRISIARALFHNSNFLVLDEATTGLDKKIEKKIFDEIFKFKPDLNLIVITHESRNLFLCEKIYTMEDGRITGCKKFDDFEIS